MFEVKHQCAHYESQIRAVPTSSKIRWQKIFVKCHLISPFFFLYTVPILCYQHRKKISLRYTRQEKYAVILDCEKSTNPLSHSILAYR